MWKKRVFDGEKSALDIRKSEEREISDQIHRSFEMLHILYPRTLNFQSFFTQDMFLKPNAKSFPFAMHYLFNILDPAEFKKRFHWPVDRTSESAFRTATVQYLNHLNEKYNLGWGEIKLFLVVMPGGMKFMKFLLELINFIVEEEIRKTEKCLPEYFSKSLTLENIEALARVYEVFMNEASKLKENLLKEVINLRKFSEALADKVNEIFKEIGLSPNQLDETFWQYFAHTNKELFERTIVSQVNEFKETERSVDKLSTEVDKLFNAQHQLPYNKHLLISSYKSILADYPKLCPKDIVTTENKIQLDSLFIAFNSIFPALKDLVEKYNLVNRMEKYEFELNQISQMEMSAEQLDHDISQYEIAIENVQSELENDLAKSINSENLTSSPNRSVCNTVVEACMKSKYINTPIIQVQSDNKTPRLPLRQNDEAQFCSVNLASTDTTPVGSASKIIDPITLLRTVTRSTSRNRQHRLNSSSVSVREETGNSFIKRTQSLPLTAAEHEDLLKTPSTSKESTLSSKKAFNRRYAIKDTFFPNHHVSSDEEDSSLQAEQEKNYNENLYLTGVTKSPSGRLNPLVKISPDFDIPKIYINNVPIDIDENEVVKEVVTFKVENRIAVGGKHQMDTDNEEANLFDLQAKIESSIADESSLELSDASF